MCYVYLYIFVLRMFCLNSLISRSWIRTLRICIQCNERQHQQSQTENLFSRCDRLHSISLIQWTALRCPVL